MADRTGIEWTDATWNPVRGCTRVSEGCRFCYAETVAARFSESGMPFHGFAERAAGGGRWTGRVETVWPLLDLPMRWRRPRRIFANSMSDLFHESLDQEDVVSIFAMMVACVHVRGHTFQVLTKRAERMRDLLNQDRFWQEVNAEAGALVMHHTDPLNRRRDDARATLVDYHRDAPPRGIWLGVSVENQAAADERIPALLGTPAALRFLSCEPLLGPVRLDTIAAPKIVMDESDVDWLYETQIDWVIAGGESGPHARPMHPDWPRGLRDQCVDAGTPFFFKQWGEWLPTDHLTLDSGPANKPPLTLRRDGTVCDRLDPARTVMHRIGKKAAGAMLDGRAWKEMP